MKKDYEQEKLDMMQKAINKAILMYSLFLTGLIILAGILIILSVLRLK